MSIDHLHIDVIIALQLIKIPIKNQVYDDFKDPIERFVSICNIVWIKAIQWKKLYQI